MRHFALTSKTRFACATLAGVLFHSGLVSAVALGNIALQSSLGQPLRVVIPIALNDGETLNTSCLKLMRDPEPGTPQLLTGRVNVERNASGTRLLVTTPRPVEEPALRVSVQAGCGNTVRRDYVLLLDPQGIGSNTMIASADPDEFKHYVHAARPEKAVRRAPEVEVMPTRSVVAVADPAPARTEFTPIALPPAAAIKPPAAVPIIAARLAKEAPPAPALVTPAPKREPVMLTAVSQPHGGFIPEAAAASLSRPSAESQLASSAPGINGPLGARALDARTDGTEDTLWTQTWPYVAVLLSILAIALTAFAKRRRVVAPAWSATAQSSGKSPIQNTGSANTFAHFAAMTEPAPAGRRPVVAFSTEHNDTTYDASLDTLLQEPEPALDGIDEHVIRRAWADVATESAVDIGSDSILKAIAAAERELHIGPQEPRQAAIDQALDDDLLREPKLPKAKR